MIPVFRRTNLRVFRRTTKIKKKLAPMTFRLKDRIETLKEGMNNVSKVKKQF